MTFFRILSALALFWVYSANAETRNLFIYDLGSHGVVQLAIEFNSQTNKTLIEVQSEVAGIKNRLFYSEISQIAEKIQIPEAQKSLSFINQDKIAFDQNEFDRHFSEQKLLPIKIDQGNQSRIFVLPLEENINELAQNIKPTVFDLYDGYESKKYLFRTFYFRLLNSNNMLEKDVSLSPQLLFTYADHNDKKNDFNYSDLKLVINEKESGKTKALNISDQFVEIDNLSQYPVSISYSRTMKDYNYHIRLPDGGKITKNISETTYWFNSNAYALHTSVNKGSSWGGANVGSPSQTIQVSYGYNPKDEPGYGVRSEELEEGLPKKNNSQSSSPSMSSSEIHVTRPQGLDQIDAYLKSFQAGLRDIVKGQPEAVDVLTKLERKHQADGLQNSKPHVVWFLGMPGTGKDTLVEAFIEVKHKLVYPLKEVQIEDHIYRLPKLKEDKDLWSLTGSGTGYRGSENVSPLIRWLVKHSGGRYFIKEVSSGNSKSQEVHENPQWKPGQVLAGYYSPDEAVLFANELHDWSKGMINAFLKEALEKGFFEIGNGGNGLNRIQVPINIILASNHGIGKIAARDNTGKRVGPPLGFEALFQRWKISSKDKTAILEELKSPTPGNHEGGCSEEILTRIPKSNFVLLRPLSKEGVKYIAKFKLEKLSQKYKKSKANGFPSLQLQFDNSLLEFLATYDQIAEDGARIVDDKISDLVERTILEAVISRKIKLDKNTIVKVSAVKNKDTTYSLLVTTGQDSVPLNLIMKGTLKEKATRAISDGRIDELNSLEERLNARVKGAEHITKELARDVRRSENSEKENNPELNERQADVYMFLGTSSTGKTELAIALHQEVYKDKGKPLVIDFSQVQTINDLKEKILGKRNSDNSAVLSDFMQEYDRRNGNLVVVFDEVANANPEVLNALYDILREPVVNTFSDKKPRSMGNVKIIMTGNAGEEWYKGIPRDIPEFEQYDAARKIYESSVGDEQFKRKFLMGKFSEAFLNRVSFNRIYFFGPHTHATIRSLIQLKLVKAVEKFNELRKGVRSWQVGFASHEDYKATIESIEKYGFKIWEQGASITQFIEKQFVNQLHDELLSRKIPQGSVVKIKKLPDVPSINSEQGTKVQFEVHVQSQKNPIVMTVRGKNIDKMPKQNPKDFILTAFHEAGHAFLSRALLGDKIRSQGVSIKPGVTTIDGQWIRYEGVAMSQEIEKMSMTRETLIARIAVLLGGGIAESLATKNYRYTAGHQNDLQRATKIATMMVVDFGLSEYQGPSRQEGQSIDAFMMSLSELQRRKIDKAVEQIRKEAQVLAEKMLMAHFQSFLVPIAKSLAAKGEVKGDVLNRYFEMKNYQLLSVYDEKLLKKEIQDYKKKIKTSSEITSATARRDFEFHDFIETSKFQVFDLKDSLKESFEQQVRTVDLSQGEKLVIKEPSLKQTLLAKKAKSVRMCLKFY